MDHFDQLHVVSDLHLGGVSGHQVCDQGPLLGAVIDELAVNPPGARLGLVMNGDIVDFLAADGATYFDPHGAVKKLEAILADDMFKPVFAALRRFVNVDGRMLVLVLGNHDVELALPDVQERLLQEICGEDEAARARVQLAMDGTGYACVVGGKRVLCVHGNDADAWNPVDQGTLRHIVKAMKRGLALPEWEPNAGTRLVIDIMNQIKARFPMVDLLKPETKPVVGVLLALDPDSISAFKKFAPIALRLTRDEAKLDLLGGGGDGVAAAPVDGDEALRRLVERRPAAPAPAPAGDDDLLAQAGAGLQAGTTARDLAAGTGDQKLGFGGLILDALFGRSPISNLREALVEWLAGDTTFALDTRDDVFEHLDESVGADIDFVIAGHTHLSRALRRKDGGAYFNSGTWIRLIRLTETMLGSDQAFTPVYEAFRAGSLAALDALPGLVLRRPHVVTVMAKDGKVGGMILEAHARSGGGAGFTVVPGSALAVD